MKLRRITEARTHADLHKVLSTIARVLRIHVDDIEVYDASGYGGKEARDLEVGDEVIENFDEIQRPGMDPVPVDLAVHAGPDRSAAFYNWIDDRIRIKMGRGSVLSDLTHEYTHALDPRLHKKRESGEDDPWSYRYYSPEVGSYVSDVRHPWDSPQYILDPVEFEAWSRNMIDALLEADRGAVLAAMRGMNLEAISSLISTKDRAFAKHLQMYGKYPIYKKKFFEKLARAVRDGV